MATIDGLTKARMLLIEAASVVSGAIVGNDLILTKHDGSTVDAGNVRGPIGATGLTGGTGPTGPAGNITVASATTDTDTLSGLATRDGYTPIAGDQILVTNQATPAQNGIYTAAAGAWSRWSSATTALQIASLGVVQVRHGLVNGGSRFVTPFSQDNTVGTTDQFWLKLDASHATDYTAKVCDLASGFTHYTEGAVGAYAYTYVQYYKDEIGIVWMTGLLFDVGAIAAGTVICNLPKGYRPGKVLRFAVESATCPTNIMVRPNGDVLLAGDIANPTTGAGLIAGTFTSMDSIHFPAEDVPNPPVWTDLTSLLVNGWQNVGTVGTDTYANVRMWMDPLGDTHFQGTVKNAATTPLTTVLSSTPTQFHTQGSNAFVFICAGAHPAGSCRVDYHEETVNGEWTLSGYVSPADATAVSFDNIILATSKNPNRWRTNGAFANSWANYASSPFGGFQVYKNPLGRVYLRGLVAGGAPSVTVGPAFVGAKWIEPRQTVVFPAIAYVGLARVDVIPMTTVAGAIGAMAYYKSGSNVFVSMAGISWDTRQR